MDPVTHTLIALIIMLVSYYIGHYFGYGRGELDGLLKLCGTIGARGIEINEDEGTVTFELEDGTSVTL